MRSEVVSYASAIIHKDGDIYFVLSFLTFLKFVACLNRYKLHTRGPATQIRYLL